MDLYQRLKTAAGFFLIAGPCVVEDSSVMEEVAQTLVRIRAETGIPVVFKASYKKANRSSGDSYSGPGLEAGLKSLQRIGEQFGLPLLTDVHEQAEVEAAAEVCDILQIPAFLSRQTDLIRAVADTGRIVNIKKGQFMAPEDMQQAALKTGANHKVLLTERGSSFGYHNLVVDFRSFAIMEALGHPVVYDVTHSLQLPSTGIKSGGNPEYAPMLAAAAIATNKVRGLFLETHPHPEQALSDAASMLPLDQLEPLVRNCLQISSALKGKS
ncbi:MAG: 3-deoxy-8-phosphooctulonate synthase [Candidatus Syntrophosphaera sp.]|nr:3-deoxy-8-phosphooctulonate synthase [Candidatus Syntrophosphaera sp.]